MLKVSEKRRFSFQENRGLVPFFFPAIFVESACTHGLDISLVVFVADAQAVCEDNSKTYIPAWLHPLSHAMDLEHFFASLL